MANSISCTLANKSLAIFLPREIFENIKIISEFHRTAVSKMFSDGEPLVRCQPLTSIRQHDGIVW
jgi:adenosylmethionine-8-amino-7-oxononanoate aminotransferase